MNPERFADLVGEALDGLPEEILAHLENVDVLVEMWPSDEQLEDAGMTGEDRRDLLGLYVGVPLVERGGDYAGVLPDQIVLFQGSIEYWTGGRSSEIADEVRRTVIHELAHHYGIDDGRLEELGWG